MGAIQEFHHYPGDVDEEPFHLHVDETSWHYNSSQVPSQRGVGKLGWTGVSLPFPDPRIVYHQQTYIVFAIATSDANATIAPNWHGQI